MSESGESVDHEVEVRVPESVTFDDGGQGDTYDERQKSSNDERFSPKRNEDNHGPPPSTYSGFSGRPAPQLFSSPIQPVNYMTKPESYDRTVSWDEFFDALINKFSQWVGNSRHQNKWLAKLESRRRQQGESAAAVGDDIRQYEAILDENYDKKKQHARAVKANDEEFNVPQAVPVTSELASFTAPRNNSPDSSSLIQEISNRLDRLEIANKKLSPQLYVPHAVDLLVVDMDLPSILGQDFLLQYCHHINYKTKTLQAEKTIVQCWIANDQTATNVENKKTVSILANCGIWVPVALTRNGDLTNIGYLEQLNTFSDDIQVLDGLIDTQSHQIHRVLVLKVTKKTTTPEIDLPEHLLDMFERSSKNLDQEQKDAFFKLLLKHKDVFSKTPDDLGCTGIIKHKIDTENEKPVRQPLRRQPIAKRDIKRREVHNKLEKGVIEPSTSAWASNLVLVAKQIGATRACVDYRQLNAKTVKDAYPLPRIDECLDALSGLK
ncbi:uncharacterized protein LOC133192867 [Saccostrea echinata]|uniref:uncharacterized protein LOC133192867 n=1 Tax=Saccostrea echinata TaxID=191078 RepID=UPI002A809FFE|nr:uncharacterized protein LOC133192867 [Saccostrea echinata]